MTDRSVADYVGYHHSAVTPHVNMLVKMGYLEEIEDYFDEENIRVERQCCVRRKHARPKNKLKAFKTIAETCYHCSGCFASDTRNRPAIGTGNLNAPLVFIGTCPDIVADQTGTLLHESSEDGAVFHNRLRSFGIASKSWFVINMLCCRYTELVGNNVITSIPAPEMIEACRTHVEALLKLIEPKIVVLLGDVAKEHFFQRVPRSFPIMFKGVQFFATRDLRCYQPLREDYHTQLIGGDIEWREIQKSLLDRGESDIEPTIVWSLPQVIREV